MKYCTKCGKKVNKTLKFCNYCGHKLTSEKVKDIIKTETKPTIEKHHNTSKYIGIGFVVLILVVSLGVYVSHQNRIQWQYQQQLKNAQTEKLQQEEDYSLLQEKKEREQADALAREYEIQSQLEQTKKEKEASDARTRLEEEGRKVAEEKLIDVEKELFLTAEKYREAKPYMERVNRGQDLSKFYPLLADYEDYAKPIILSYLGLNYPLEPSNDEELWNRGMKVYNWLSENYKYCGDKGLRVGNTFYQFQFYSPDELLMSDISRCGDCDDFATLFAGLMYASGVPENKVWMVCGTVPSGAHCWNRLILSTNTYIRVDGVCSRSVSYTDLKMHVDCFSEYNAKVRMNPSDYIVI